MREAEHHLPHRSGVESESSSGRLAAPDGGGSPAAVLEVDDLVVQLAGTGGRARPVDGLSFSILPGETLGIVGESGAGKSMAALSILGLLPPAARITSGRILFEGRDLVGVSSRDLRRIRGNEIAMVFQDPMNSLNPVFTVGAQLEEAIQAHHKGLGRGEVKRRVLELLDAVGLPHPSRHYRQYPLELSGGMRQRVVIAMAMANKPRLIIADEPTTALDVTIQAQVLEVLKTVHVETGAALILITHDLGLVAEMASRLVVMYGGRAVEVGDVFSVFDDPRHPYTAGLLGSLPQLDSTKRRLDSIAGHPPRLGFLPVGCAFEPRCGLGHGRGLCNLERPELVEIGVGRSTACHYHAEVSEPRLSSGGDQ